MDTTHRTAIDHVTLEVADAASAEAFYAEAFGLGDTVRVREADAPTSGFRGFTLSLVVAQPSTVDSLVGTALDAGATVLKPVAKSFWGYGGVVRAPDGAIWKVASSAKKDSGPATREVDDVVLLLGVQDVRASKQFYADHGLAVGKSFGSRYVELDTPGSALRLALYTRRAAAKDAGVDPDGSGSHRLVVHGDVVGSLVDPDGFEWRASPR
ncbi:glyoxalase [Cellulosimicrobium arenosum]|uniref:Glyoxalase n=1 Tax=Cellulosimicrobium arenosum TaxID=2708133 RepID=A0A927G807_9MICO|nr:glyoxalase [Cellulosimicrobium arenosum]MBD8078410.1 glyoxalase [Cellulosimicrobium arenosum]